MIETRQVGKGIFKRLASGASLVMALVLAFAAVRPAFADYLIAQEAFNHTSDARTIRQYFTVPTAGTISSVEYYFCGDSASPRCKAGNYVLKLYPDGVAGPVVAATVLTSTVGWVTFPFTTPVPVSAGALSYFELELDSHSYTTLAISSGNPYGGGSYFEDGTEFSDYDATFRIPTITSSGSGTTVGGLDGRLSKNVDHPNARVGDIVSFALTASNPNEEHMSEVTVKDTLPAGLDFVDASTSQGSYVYDPAARMVTFSLWQMEAGATASMVVRARVNKDNAAGTVIRNVATINGLWSNESDVIVIPGALPGAGEPLPQGLALGALALVALVLAGAPLAGRALAGSRGR